MRTRRVNYTMGRKPREVDYPGWWVLEELKEPLGLCQCGCGLGTRNSNWNVAATNLLAGRPRKYVQGHVRSRHPSEVPPDPNPSGVCACGCGSSTKIQVFRTRCRDGHRTHETHNLYVNGHTMVGYRYRDYDNYTIEDRGHSTPCWIWRGKLDRGYGPYQWFYNQKYGTARANFSRYVLRHHICEVKACVNPEHIMVVTAEQHKNIHAGNARVANGKVIPNALA